MEGRGDGVTWLTVQPAYLNEGGGGVAHQLLTGSLRRHTSASFSRIVVSAPYLLFKSVTFDDLTQLPGYLSLSYVFFIVNNGSSFCYRIRDLLLGHLE